MKSSKSHSKLPATGKRVVTQRQRPALKLTHLVAYNGKAKPIERHMRAFGVIDNSPGVSGGEAADRKNIQVIAFAIIDAGHPIGANEFIILRVLQNLSIRCRVAELRRELCYLEGKGIIRIEREPLAPWRVRLVGPATGIAEGDAHTTTRAVAETPRAASPRSAGKAVRADSRRSKRVSR